MPLTTLAPPSQLVHVEVERPLEEVLTHLEGLRAHAQSAGLVLDLVGEHLHVYPHPARPSQWASTPPGPPRAGSVEVWLRLRRDGEGTSCVGSVSEVVSSPLSPLRHGAPAVLLLAVVPLTRSSGIRAALLAAAALKASGALHSAWGRRSGFDAHAAALLVRTRAYLQST